MKVLLKAVAVAGLASFAVVGAAASASFAVAVHPPVTASSPPCDTNSNPYCIPLGSEKQVTSFSANCPSTIQNPDLTMWIVFVDGNGHFYGPTNHPLTNGGNVEGDAYFFGSVPGPSATSPPTVVYQYFGQAHGWFGNNNFPSSNPGAPAPGPNAEVTAGTLTFHGTGDLGTLDVQDEGGQTISASGHPSGWGHFKMTC